MAKVQSIKYGSTGLISLKGLGEPLKQVKEFLIYLIDIGVERKKRKVQIEKEQAQTESIRIRNRRDVARARREEAKAFEVEVKVLTNMLKNKPLADAIGKTELESRAKFFVEQRLPTIDNVASLPLRRKMLSIEYKSQHRGPFQQPYGQLINLLMSAP